MFGLGKIGTLGLHRYKKGAASLYYTGQVATRTRIPSSLASGNASQVMSESGHIARDAITAMQVGVANWRVNTTVAPGSEVNGDALTQLSVSVGYPYASPTWTQLTFSGTALTTALAGALKLTDLVTLPTPIAAGDKFLIRIWRQSSTNNMLYTGGITGVQNIASFSDNMNYANDGSLSDLTLGGTITNKSADVVTYPTLILGTTKKASVILVGDSRTAGHKETVDSTGDSGDLARSIGATVAYLNAGISGDYIQGFATSNAKRLALFKYFSHCIFQLGTNDECVGSRTLVQMQGDYATAWAAIKAAGMASPGRLYQFIGEPRTTSAANTTPAAGDAVRLTRFTWVRTTPSPLNGYFDCQAYMESSSLWAVTADQNDGTHETRTGYLHVASGGAIPPATFTR